MKRVTEYEIWSEPGKLLSDGFGKDFAEKCHILGIPSDVVIGLYSIPDHAGVQNLKMAIQDGEFLVSDFLSFCEIHRYQPEVSNQESASKFLEYRNGRCLAWVHFPEGGPDELLQIISTIVTEHDLRLIGPV